MPANDASPESPVPEPTIDLVTGLHAKPGQWTSIARHLKLGQILVQNRLITQEQLEQALEANSRGHRRLGQVLRSMGLVSEQQIAEVLSRQFGLPIVDLRSQVIDPSAVASVPSQLAHRFVVFPLRRDGTTLHLAMSDPLDVTAEDLVRAQTGLTIRPVIAPESQIFECLLQHYPTGKQTYDMLDMMAPDTQEQIISVDDLKQDMRELLETSGLDSVIHAVNSILADGIKRGASDIHLEPFEQAVRLRYRVDGKLQQTGLLPLATHPAVVSRIKILANLDISESRRPQDGAFKATVGKRSVSFRISTLRTGSGEKVVIRVLDSTTQHVELRELGLLPPMLAELEAILDQPQGILLVTGPTGSGKTTTLYSAINHLRRDELNIVTVEDPVEYPLANVNQVQVDERGGITFAAALRSILRQDPNVIMIGEIRDLETAEIAIRASLTGHLVLATLHTNDAASAPARLTDMGVEPSLLGASLHGVMAQRLVRRLCTDCSQTERRPIGCRECDFTGFSGRVGVYELIVPNRDLRTAITHGATAGEIECLAHRSGTRLLQDDAKAKVEMGWTTAEQAVAVVGRGFNLGSTDQIIEEPPTISDRQDAAEPPGGYPASIGAPPAHTEDPPLLEAETNTVVPARSVDTFAPELRPVIRLEIRPHSTQLAAHQGAQQLASVVIAQGPEEWISVAARDAGIPVEKLIQLLAMPGVSGLPMVASIYERLGEPIVKLMASVLLMIDTAMQRQITVKIVAEPGAFPWLADAFRACSPLPYVLCSPDDLWSGE